MDAHRKAGAFARAHKKHLLAGHVAAAAIALLVAFLLGAFAGPAIKTVFGVKLNAAGQHAYAIVASHGERELVKPGEELPPAIAAKVAAANAKLAARLAAAPHPLATPQPKMLVQPIPRNYSSRNGTRPVLLVAHDTESPQEPGLADVEAIRAWFSNPAAQASANYVVDGDGNTLELVPDYLKAWHVAYFNPWAIGVEQIGYATQTRWPLAQLEATARIFAHEATRYGIPIQQGAVSGCRILRPGIVEHAGLGLCGGGHHDAGAHYPLAKLIQLSRMYAHAAAPKPTPKPKPKPAPKKAVRVQVPAVVLRLWSHGRPVTLLQRNLRQHGLRVGVDGAFGWQTWAAVRAFQKKHHLRVDGTVGPATRAALNR